MLPTKYDHPSNDFQIAFQFFFYKLIICIHSILRLLYISITKIPKGVMKNYFTCKRIILITPLGIL